MFEKCPCGSTLYFSKCCKPYIKGRQQAPTPEALMRSRYSAYVTGEIDYIVDTSFGDKNQINRNGIKDWSEKSKWLGLTIISAKTGTEEDTDTAGIVEFKAEYERKQLRRIHHEIAKFIKRDGLWYYFDGTILPEQVIRNGTKIGRNETCICNSMKKYKHCCGR